MPCARDLRRSRHSELPRRHPFPVDLNRRAAALKRLLFRTCDPPAPPGRRSSAPGACVDKSGELDTRVGYRSAKDLSSVRVTPMYKEQQITDTSKSHLRSAQTSTARDISNPTGVHSCASSLCPSSAALSGRTRSACSVARVSGTSVSHCSPASANASRFHALPTRRVTRQ